MEYSEIVRQLADERHNLKEAQHAMIEAELRLKSKHINRNGGIKMLGTNEAEQKRVLEMVCLDDERCTGYREIVSELERTVSNLQAELDIYNEKTKTARWTARALLLEQMQGLSERSNLSKLFEAWLDELVDDQHQPSIPE